MTDISYLIFMVGQTRYGIAATAVQELFFLPDVTPLPNLPRWVIGVIDLRGDILPIVDLGVFLGQGAHPYHLSDSVIVLQLGDQSVGLLVQQTDAVTAIALDQIAPWSTPDDAPVSTFIGIAKVGGALVTLLNPLVFAGLTVQTAMGTDLQLQGQVALEQDAASPANGWESFSEGDRQILRQRRDGLRQSVETDDPQTLTALAVMGLQGEYFGLMLDIIHEFTDIHTITPIPCCPPHILGNINLRGEVVTLVDISPVINLSGQGQTRWKKAIVVRHEEIVAGIAVDAIFDVVHLQASQILPSPVATQSSHNDYLQGVAPYRNGLMSVINLPKILTSGVLDVDEEV
jgi:purine-binding chemotaxis protein CheW